MLLQSAVEGGSQAAVLNAANEEAVAAFLAGRVPFTAIPDCIADVMSARPAQPLGSLEDVLAADAWARRQAADRLARLPAAARH